MKKILYIALVALCVVACTPPAVDESKLFLTEAQAEELIAQVPIKDRTSSRLMVLDKNKKTIEDKIFKDILDYLKPGDCLVRNNTKVIPARLYGKKEDTKIDVEFLLLKRKTERLLRFFNYFQIFLLKYLLPFHA